MTFEGLEPDKYRYSVVVKVPRLFASDPVDVGYRHEQPVLVPITFREFQVAAEPGFRLYVADARVRLAIPGPKRGGDYLVGESGAVSSESPYYLGASDGSVRFAFWPVPMLWAVLGMSEQKARETDPFEVDGHKAERKDGYAVPDQKKGPFRSIWFQAQARAGPPP